MTVRHDQISDRWCEQAAYVVWRDGVVASPSKRGQGRGGRNQITALKSDLPAADPGAVTIHRWRKRRERKWNSGMTLAQQAMVRSQAEQIRAYIKAIRKGGGLLREMAEAGERQTGRQSKTPTVARRDRCRPIPHRLGLHQVPRLAIRRRQCGPLPRECPDRKRREPADNGEAVGGGSQDHSK